MSIHENPWENLALNSKTVTTPTYPFPFKEIRKESHLDLPNTFDGIIIKCKICSFRILRSRFTHHFFERHSLEESEKPEASGNLECCPTTETGMILDSSTAKKSPCQDEEDDNKNSNTAAAPIFSLADKHEPGNVNEKMLAQNYTMDEINDFEFLESKSLDAALQNGENYRFHVDSLPWEMEELEDQERLHSSGCVENEVKSAVASIIHGRSGPEPKELEAKSSHSSTNDLLFLLSSEKVPSPCPSSDNQSQQQQSSMIDTSSLIDQFASEKFPFLSPCQSPAAVPEEGAKNSIDVDAERMIALIHNKLKESGGRDKNGNDGTACGDQDQSSSLLSLQQQGQHQKKKIKKLNSLDCIPLHLRPFDPRLHCGVVKDGVMCRRSLLCKIHSMGLKRQVSRPGDVNSLMKELREANRLKRLRANSGLPQGPLTNVKPVKNCLPLNQKPILLQTSTSHLFTSPQSVQTFATSKYNSTSSVASTGPGQNGLTIFTTPANGQQAGNPNVLTFLHTLKSSKAEGQVSSNYPTCDGQTNGLNKTTTITNGIPIAPMKKCTAPITLQDGSRQSPQSLINKNSLNKIHVTSSQSQPKTIIFTTTTSSPTSTSTMMKPVLDNSCLKITSNSPNDCQMHTNFTSQIPILMKCGPQNVGTIYSTASQQPTTISIKSSTISSSYTNSEGCNQQRAIRDLHESKVDESDDKQGSWRILQTVPDSLNNSNESAPESSGYESSSRSNKDRISSGQKPDHNDQSFDELDDIMTNILNITNDQDGRTESETDGFIQEIFNQDFISSEPNNNMSKDQSDESRQVSSNSLMDIKSVSSIQSTNSPSTTIECNNPRQSNQHDFEGSSPQTQLMIPGSLQTSTSPPSSNLSNSSGYHTENSTTGSFLTLTEWKELQKNSGKSSEMTDYGKEKQETSEEQIDSSGDFCDDINNLLQSVSTNKETSVRQKVGQKSSRYSDNQPHTYLKVGNKKIKLSQEDLDNMILTSDVDTSTNEQTWPAMNYDIDEICNTEKCDEERGENGNSVLNSACQSPASSSATNNGNSRLRLLLYEDSKDFNYQNYKNMVDSNSYPSDSSVDSNGYASTNSSFLPRIDSNPQPMNVPTAIVAPTTVTTQSESSVDPTAFTKPTQCGKTSTANTTNQNISPDVNLVGQVQSTITSSGHTQIVLNSLPNCSLAITSSPNFIGQSQNSNFKNKVCSISSASLSDEKNQKFVSYYNDKMTGYEENKGKVLQHKNLTCIPSVMQNGNLTPLSNQNSSQLNTLQFSAQAQQQPQQQSQYHQILDPSLKNYYGNQQVHLIPSSAFKGTPLILPSGTILTSSNPSIQTDLGNGQQTVYQVATSSDFQPKNATYSTLGGFTDNGNAQQTNSTQTVIQQSQIHSRPTIYANNNFGGQQPQQQQQFNIIMAPKSHLNQAPQQQQTQAPQQQQQHFQATTNSSNGSHTGPVQFFRLSNGQIISGIPSSVNYQQSFNPPTTIMTNPTQNTSLQLQQLHIQGTLPPTGQTQMATTTQLQPAAPNHQAPAHYAINTNSKGQSFLIKYPQGTLLQPASLAHKPQEHEIQQQHHRPLGKNLSLPTLIAANGNTYHLQQANQSGHGTQIISNQTAVQMPSSNSNLVQVVLVPNDDHSRGMGNGQTLQMSQQFSGNIQLQTANCNGKAGQQATLFSTASAGQTLDKFSQPKQPGNNVPATAILLNGRMARTVYSTSTSNFA